MKQFPKGFYWGAATSSFQVEGGIENMDWAACARDGRVPEIGRACDHYHRYDEDFAIAQSLGHNCHRLSIEWARIEPEEGRFDEKEIEHYRAVLRALRARGLEPFITLWHFSLPLWFANQGGFEHPRSPELFARYCAYVVEQLGDLCTHYATINELHPYVSNGWRRGTWPPFKKWPGIDWVRVPGYKNPTSKSEARFANVWKYVRVFHHLTDAHNRAYKAIKHLRPQCEVGIVHHVIYFRANANPLNVFLAWFMNLTWTHYLMWCIRGSYDSIGVNYYFHKKFGDTATYEKTDMGWDAYPEGIEGALRMLQRYRTPLYVSEAGVADERDALRSTYIAGLVRGMGSALAQGVDLRGFMYWSLLDNYELAQGYTKRFGLVAINYETLERTIRPSAYVYKRIIERNGLVD